MAQESKFFQDYMPGNVCFGCGAENPDGLQIKSFWDGDEGVCTFQSQPKYHGWETVINGGILATLVDCHTMCTAMADAYRREDAPSGRRQSIGMPPAPSPCVTASQLPMIARSRCAPACSRSRDARHA